ncbi:MAG: 3-deoxy-manno-octulosonate cytidylyltransferase [Gammaproteobacteria bacterium]|nr:3-deoxy-manno-octulosonate cytidylyltransferase [Gammaproteobacteria bacterium]
MSVDYHIVIPARLAAERLPGKPLLSVAGRPLIEHVHRRAMESRAASVVIATDAEEIRVAAEGFGARAVMTDPDHQSGSDRIAECADRLGWDDDTLVVNLQGDEPLMPPGCLDQAAGLLAADSRAQVASLYWPIDNAEEAEDPNAVKVVVAEDGAALYFSRSLIPHPRGAGGLAEALASGCRWRRHIGLYAYRAGALRAFAAMRPAALEKIEKLEQLRFLENGYRIAMAQARSFIPAGVDTPEDLERLRESLGGA